LGKIIALHFRLWRKEKRLVTKFHFVLSFAQTNFRIAEQNLNFDFKNAWKMLSETEPRLWRGEATNLKNLNFEKMRCLLDEVRTFFEENPNAEF